MDITGHVIERAEIGEKRSLLYEFAGLFREVFGKEIRTDFIDWRYFSNPYGGPFMYLARNKKGKLIANYSGAPVPLLIDGKAEMSLLSMSTMTHPEYCGRGLFTDLASKLYAEAKNKFACVWGFPNANSHPAFVAKLEWRDIYELPTKSICIPNASRGLQTDSVVADDSFSLDYPDLLDPAARVAVIKNTKYLQWRYRDNPVNKYKCFAFTDDNRSVKGFAVIKLFEASVDIVELHGQTKQILESLLSAVCFYGSQAKLANLNLWVMPWMRSHAIIEKHGAKNSAPITYFGARCLAPETSSLITNPGNWSIQMGDSDVY